MAGRPVNLDVYPSVISTVPDDGIGASIENNVYPFVNMFGGGTWRNYGDYAIGGGQLIVQNQTGEWNGVAQGRFCGNTAVSVTADFTFSVSGTDVTMTIQRPVLRRARFVKSGVYSRSNRANLYINDQLIRNWSVDDGPWDLYPQMTLPGGTWPQTITLRRNEFRDIKLFNFSNLIVGGRTHDIWDVMLRLRNDGSNHPNDGLSNNFISHRNVHLREGELFGGVSGWGTGQGGHYDIEWGLTPTTMTNKIRYPATGNQSGTTIPYTLLSDLTPHTDYYYRAKATNEMGYSVQTQIQRFQTWYHPMAMFDGSSMRSLNDKTLLMVKGVSPTRKYGLVFTGSQRIETGIQSGAYTTACVKTKVTDYGSNRSILGYAEGTSASFYIKNYNSSTLRLGNGTSYLSLPALELNKQYELKYRNRRPLIFTIDGVEAARDSSVTSVSYQSGLNIGSTSAFSANSNFAGTIYGVKVWIRSNIDDLSDGSLVFDGVPVPIGDTQYSATPAPSNCLWDKVSQRYFENNGTGELGIEELPLDVDLGEMGTFDENLPAQYGPGSDAPQPPTMFNGATMRNQRIFMDIPPLDTPELTLAIVGQSMTASWPAVSEATNYQVIVTGGGYNYNQNQATTAVTLNNLPYGEYQILVRAYNATQTSETAIEEFAISQAPLGAPSNLVLSSTPFELTAKWDAATSADFYNITITNGTTTFTQQIFGTTFTYGYAEEDLGNLWAVTVTALQFDGAVSNPISDEIQAPTPLPAPDDAVVVAGGRFEAIISSISSVVGASSYEVILVNNKTGATIASPVASLLSLPQSVTDVQGGSYTPNIYAVDSSGNRGFGLTLPEIDIVGADIVFTVTNVLSGTASCRITNKWTTPIIVNGVSVAPTASLVASNLKVGDTVSILESQEGVTFKAWENSPTPFISRYGSNVCGVEITAFPSMDKFLVAGGLPNNAFSYFFESLADGFLTGAPSGMFDFSEVTSAGNTVCYRTFYGALISPTVFDRISEGSFQFTNLRSVGNNFCTQMFSGSNNGRLPDGSFNFPLLQGIGTNFCQQFIRSNKAMTKLPDGSFQFPSLSQATVSSFCMYFGDSSALASIPTGSFQLPVGTSGTGFGNFATGSALTSGNQLASITFRFAVDNFAPVGSGLPQSITAGQTVLINGNSV